MSAMNAQEPGQPEETGKVRLLRRRSRRTRVPLRNRMPRVSFAKEFILIPSLFTAGNFMCGFFSVIATFRGEYVDRRLAHLAGQCFRRHRWLCRALDSDDQPVRRRVRFLGRCGVFWRGARQCWYISGPWCRGKPGVGWRHVLTSFAARCVCPGSMFRRRRPPKIILSVCRSRRRRR